MLWYKTDINLNEVIVEIITLEIETVLAVKKSVLKILRQKSNVNELALFGD
ncbi:MAG: hypothetical protein H7101_13775 [Deinococcales bacterium]|nr:hypothetical protein [Chitinophagaceae bacterium]